MPYTSNKLKMKKVVEHNGFDFAYVLDPIIRNGEEEIKIMEFEIKKSMRRPMWWSTYNIWCLPFFFVTSNTHTTTHSWFGCYTQTTFSRISTIFGQQQSEHTQSNCIRMQYGDKEWCLSPVVSFFRADPIYINTHTKIEWISAIGATMPKATFAWPNPCF